jgi:hypothetical protein
MSDKNIEPKGSFWTTVPGCITAVGGLVSVVIAGVVALSAAGFIQPPFSPTATSPAPIVVTVAISNSETGNVPSAPDTELPPAIPTRVPPTHTALPVVKPIVIELDDQDQEPARTAICDHHRQDMRAFGRQFWMEGDQLFGAGPDCGLSFAFDVQETNYYQLTLYATYAPDFGVLRLSLMKGTASNEMFKIDLYGQTVTHTGPIDLGNWLLTAGERNRFSVWVDGKNAVSSDFKFGLDYLELQCLNQIRNGRC